MSTTAAEIMTSPAITALPEQSVAEVAQLLASHRISAVPVCTPDGALLGMISELEIIRPFRESARARGDWWLARLAEGEVLSQDFLDHMRRDNRHAADVMVRHVISAGVDASLPELAELMSAHGVKRLPVLREGKVVGVVSRADLVKAIARAPGMLV